MVLTSPDIDVTETFKTENLLIPDEYTENSFAMALASGLEGAEFDRKKVRVEESGLEFYKTEGFIPRLKTLHENIWHGVENPPLRDFGKNAVYFALGGDSGGSEFVQQGHIATLSDLGLLTYLVDFPWPFQDASSYLAWKKERMVRFYKNTGPTRFLPLFGEMYSPTGSEAGFSNDAHMEKRETLVHSAQKAYLEHFFSLNSVSRKVFSKNSPDIIFSNYAYSLPAVTKVFPDRNYKLAVELHDWLAHQNRIRRKIRDEIDFDPNWNDQLDLLEIQDEIDTAQLADVAIAISGPLAKSYQENSNANVTLLRPITPTEKWDNTELDLNDPNACKEYLKTNISRSRYMDVALKLRTTPKVTIDLLFVGTNHPANNVSLLSFLENIFFPHLAPKGLKLFIAGTIAKALKDADSEMMSKYSDSIIALGRVDKLEPLYQMAKIIVLMITEGTGFPTKVIEAMSAAQCFVVNDRALYDLASEARCFFAVSESPEEMADDILRLSEDIELRRERAKNGFEFVETFFSRTNYYKQMASLLDIDAKISLPTDEPDDHREATPFPISIEEDEFLAVENKHTYLVNGEGIPADYMIGEWSFAESSHTWIDGKRAGFLFRSTNDLVPTRIYLAASTVSELVETGQSIRVVINGYEAGVYKFDKNFVLFDIEVPHGCIQSGAIFVLEFVADQTVEVPGDPRALSVCVKELTFSCERAVAVPGEVNPDEAAELDDGIGEQATDLLSAEPTNVIKQEVFDSRWIGISPSSGFLPYCLSGDWSYPEADGVWLAGLSGLLHLSWIGEGFARRFVALIATDLDALPDHELTVQILVNGISAGSFVMMEKYLTLECEIPTDADNDDGDYTVEFVPNEVFNPPEDARSLSIMLLGFSLSNGIDARPDEVAVQAEPEVEELGSAYDFEAEYLMSGRIALLNLNKVYSPGPDAILSTGMMGDWSFPELGHQWIDGTEAGLFVGSKEGEEPAYLILEYSFLNSLVENEADFKIVVNGIVVLVGNAQPGLVSSVIPITDEIRASRYLIHFNLFETGSVEGDPRNLSLSFSKIALANREDIDLSETNYV